MNFLSKIFGDANKRALKKIEPIIFRINDFGKNFEKISNEELPKYTEELKVRYKKGETLDDILPEAFALVRETAKRTLNQCHYDVQLVGGAVLHQGKIAEMKTGEGKTLVATLSAYLNAIAGGGVHIVTVNDYLARRDAVWMGQIYNALGLSVSCLDHESSYLYDSEYIQENQKLKIENQNENENLKIKINDKDKERDELGSFKIIYEYLRPCSRKEAYQADIVYGTNSEFGFDYLKDNMVYDLSLQVQRGQNYAIIDEVDSILIDEARTPLIISAPDTDSTKLYAEFSKIIPRLEENIDYNIDEKMKAVSLTENGIEKVEQFLNIKDIYSEKGVRYVYHLEQALKAETLFKKNRDYVVKNGEVIIVDEFTGRLMPGRRYSGGLHQAIEAKEGVFVKQESRTLASITFQNYFKMYKKISGMTGTAITSAEEFHKVYNLDIVSVPTNNFLIRKDQSDLIFQTENGKFKAIVEEIKKRNQIGQPVLVGTVSIEKNEKLGAYLSREGITHQILNAKNHEKEAEIIAQAGKSGQVTIATNMAGRGVDIILGGNPQDIKDAEKVKAAGGLYVIGTERHEARRIDNQLRGRAGRQGDPGESRFFVSLEDDLMRIFVPENIKKLMKTLGIPEEQPIENKMVSRSIESAQSKIEGNNFDIRHYVLEYDNVMNKQRETIYKKRKEILSGYWGDKKIKEAVFDLFENFLKQIVLVHTASDFHQDWNLEEIAESVKSVAEVRETIHSKISDISKKEINSDEKRKEIIDYLMNVLKSVYEMRDEKIGDEMMRQIEKNLFLQILDSFWIDHLEVMDHLRDSVRLRAYGQRDPLIEYKNEGHRLFKELLTRINEAIIGNIFKVEVAVKNSEVVSKASANSANLNLNKSASRNDLCPCGSGKKYKKCHGA